MELFTGIFYIVVAVLYITQVSMLTTNGVYTLIFKILPIAIGLASVFLALNHFGFVIQIG